jgi:phage major head subunit gpT-like protein
MSTALLSRSMIRGEFYPAFESRVDAYGLADLVERTQSAVETETYRFVSGVPRMRKHTGQMALEPFRTYKIDVRNEEYRAEVMIPTKDIRRDQTGHIQRRINELAMSAAEHPVALIDDLLSAGDTSTYGLAYDGQTFFDTDHVVGESGTINNAIAAAQVASLNIATPAQPTAEEASKFLLDCIAYMMGWKDDKGRPINVNVNSTWLVHCPPTMFGGMMAGVANANLAGGATNPLKQFNIRVVPNAGVDWTTEFAIFNVGKSTKPFILQEEAPVTISTLDQDNAAQFVEEHSAVGVIAKWEGAAAYGDPFSALKATLS